MNRVLQFPKERSKKIRRERQVERQRLILGLSLFSFILVAVLANESLMRNQRPIYLISDNSPHSLEQVNRAIASAQPMNMFRDVEWEQDLAKRLADKSNRMPASASVSGKLTLMDQLRYGDLAGKYRIQATPDDSAKVNEISYIDSSEVADRPVQLKSSSEFLQQYQPLMAVDFAKVSMVDKNNGIENWELLSDEGLVMGHATLRFDDANHFLGLNVQARTPASAE